MCDMCGCGNQMQKTRPDIDSPQFEIDRLTKENEYLRTRNPVVAQSYERHFQERYGEMYVENEQLKEKVASGYTLECLTVDVNNARRERDRLREALLKIEDYHITEITDAHNMRDLAAEALK